MSVESQSAADHMLLSANILKVSLLPALGGGKKRDYGNEVVTC